jgi:hypothetical protein
MQYIYMKIVAVSCTITNIGHIEAEENRTRMHVKEDNSKTN